MEHLEFFAETKCNADSIGVSVYGGLRSRKFVCRRTNICTRKYGFLSTYVKQLCDSKLKQLY